jgi:hypothetical protein
VIAKVIATAPNPEIATAMRSSRGSFRTARATTANHARTIRNDGVQRLGRDTRFGREIVSGMDWALLKSDSRRRRLADRD